MKDTFFTPAFFKSGESYKYISEHTQINTEDEFIYEALDLIKKEAGKAKSKSYGSINLIPEIPDFIKTEICNSFGLDFSGNEEAYVIKAEDNIDIFSLSGRGLMYGAMALKRLAAKTRLRSCLAYESPVCEVRGIKIYLPSPDDIESFKKTIDMAAYCQYNTAIIEIGGAMEYLSHPEVNDNWVKYCDDINSRSDRAKQIQEKTFGWQKNSIHAENGGGKFLSQESVSMLVSYCRERHFNVIPELPLLSHSDYLLAGHPELRERKEDPYPDTYCPGNPDTYSMVFDLIDEVISVFDPEILHIGHDEYYSIGLCERCRGKQADDIYSDDIKKIHAHLSKKGVKTMMWGDKLLDAYLPGYGPCGGAEIMMNHPGTGEITGIIPATYNSIDKIPSDIIIMHWYWSVEARLEKKFTERRLYTVYGNFYGPQFPNWETRLKKGICGAVISNWSALKIDNLRRNGFIFNLAYSYIMFWKNEYNEKNFRQISKSVLTELYRLNIDDLKSRNNNSSIIEITHTADYPARYKEFSDGTFIDKNSDTLGHYAIFFDNGKKYNIPIVYGENISHRYVSWESYFESESAIIETDRRIPEVAYMTCPFETDDGTWYRFAFENPYPSFKIIKIEINKAKPDTSIFFHSIRIL